MEYLDIADIKGRPTGEKVERTIAHEQGILHRTSHVWLLRKHNNETEILIQKRCDNKDSNPGCYDVSSAGHIPAGSDFLPSAIRELEEELGISAQESELIYCGRRHKESKNTFHGKLFWDNQISNVYVLWRDISEHEIRFQESEISAVKWVLFSALYEKVKANAIPNCIAMEEMEMLKNYLKG